jgi:hypothetical protein
MFTACSNTGQTDVSHLVGGMYRGHDSLPDSRHGKICLKRMDGLHNLLEVMDVAQHQYWPECGVGEDRNTFQVLHNPLKYFPSSAIHSRSASVNHFRPRASAQQISPYIRAFNRSAPLVPDQLPAGAKMGEMSKMDSNSLIAAALAPPVPSALFKNYRKQVKNSYGSELVPHDRDEMQQVNWNFIFSSL